MTKYEYREIYLKSAHWKRIRDRVIAENDHKCEICGAVGPLEVHHKTYTTLWREHRSELACLCHDCHSLIHHYMKMRFGNGWGNNWAEDRWLYRQAYGFCQKRRADEKTLDIHPVETSSDVRTENQ